MKQEKVTMSVLTAAHNRCSKITRLYESLLKQTISRRFEWIILDDGSTDKTKETVQKFIQDGQRFDIQYFYQENQGKHIAVNKLFELANGEYSLIIDDDDELLPDALEKFYSLWDTYGSNQKLWCICGRCIDAGSGRMVGEKLPDNINELPWKERKAVSEKTEGERCGCMRTKYLKRYRYPDIKGMKFIPESYLWRRLDAVYEQYYVNEPFRIYHQFEGISLSNRPKSKERYESDFKMYRVLLNDPYLRPGFLSRLYLIYIYSYRLAAVHTEQTGRNMYDGLKTEDRIVLCLTRFPCFLLRCRIKDNG